MSEIEELFCEMTARADFMRQHKMHTLADEQAEFHVLIRSRRRELTRAQRVELFRQWQHLDRARMRIDVAKLQAQLAASEIERYALIAEQHWQARDPIYPCPCGDTFDIRDGKAVAAHRPHIDAANPSPHWLWRSSAPEWSRKEPPLA